MPARVRINRRAVLKCSAGCAFSAGFVEVAGCSNEGRSAPGSQHQNDAVKHTLKGTDLILTDKGEGGVQLSLLYLADAPWPIYQPGMRSATQEDCDAHMLIILDGVQDPTLGLCSETQFRRGGQINKAIGNLESDILQGRKPVSAWDDGVQQWKKDGGDKIRDELQKSLEQRQES